MSKGENSLELHAMVVISLLEDSRSPYFGSSSHLPHVSIERLVGCTHAGEQPNTADLVDVSGTHYVAVMAKMPPAAPATEWMKESLVIVLWTDDIV